MANDDGLDDNLTDRLVAISKGAVSLVPFAGGPLAEAIGAIIRGQRGDRIAAYLRALAERVDDLEGQVRGALANEPEKIGLIEEGAFQAARATTAERIALIVEAVAHGLDEQDADVIRRKRLLTTLGELDNDEIAILNAYGLSYGTGDYSAFDNLNRPDPSHMQSSIAEFDSEKLYEAGKDHLLRLGLLKKSYNRPRKGEIPEFDVSKGDFKHSVEVSYFGRMLLREIGMTPPFDADQEE